MYDDIRKDQLDPFITKSFSQRFVLFISEHALLLLKYKKLNFKSWKLSLQTDDALDDILNFVMLFLKFKL